MPGLSQDSDAILEALRSRYGGELASNTAPALPLATPPFERLATSVLSQSCIGRAAPRAWQCLADAGLSDPDSLADAGLDELVQALVVDRPAVRRAVAALQNVSRWIVDSGGFEALEVQSTDSLRDALQLMPGLGPTAVETILLEGFGRPVYPLDRPSYRVAARHGWIDLEAPFNEARDALTEALGPGLERLGAFHRAFNAVAAEHCRVRVALCDGCPLARWLPASGPLGDPSEA